MSGTLNVEDLCCLDSCNTVQKNIVKVNLDAVERHVRCSLHVLWMGEFIMNLKFLSNQ